MMLKLRLFVIPCLFAFAMGAVVGVYTPGAVIVAVILGFSGLLLLARAMRGTYPLTTVLIVAVMLFAVGMLRGAARKDRMHDPVLNGKIGQMVNVEGVVSREPELRGGKQRLTITLTDRSDDENILVVLPRNPVYAYGDQLRMHGKLTAPEDFRTESGKTFRYVDFLHARGTMLLLNNARAEKIGDHRGNVIIEWLFSSKQAIAKVVDRLPAPESGLLMGMIFGGKEGLPVDVQNDFRTAGLLHIIVLSGENLTIIALLVTLLVRKFLGFISGLTLSSMVVIAYAIIGGLEPATLRALFVILLLFASFLLRREARLPRVISIGALILLSANPLLLFDDPSFQLSMLAILGLLYMGPVIERRLLLSGISVSMVSYLAPILGAQLGVLPYVVWQSQSIASYALLANILILFFIGFLSVGGIILVGAGMLFPSLFPILAVPIEFALSVVLQIAHMIAGLPWATIPLALPGWVVASIYCVLCVWLYRVWRSPEMSPLARFALREETKQLAKRKIPWTAPLPEAQGILLDSTTLEFSFEKRDHAHVERIGVVDWSDH